MAGASDYMVNKALDHFLGTTAYTFIGTVYVSLHTADPDVGGLDEVTGGSYARQPCDFDAASGAATQNASDVTFTGMPAVTVTHFGIMDAISGGNLLFSNALTGGSQAFLAGQDAIFRDGDLDVSGT